MACKTVECIEGDSRNVESDPFPGISGPMLCVRVSLLWS